MIRAHGEIRIERPPEEVFDFLADLRNEPEFNPDAKDIVKVTGGPIGLGTVYTENVKPLGDFEVRIDRFEPPRVLGFGARNARADIAVVFTLAPLDGAATHMTADMEMRPKGPMRLMSPLLRPMMSRVMQRQRAPKIKDAVESLPRPVA